MRVVFFGTPSFAVPSLRALVEAGADLVGVVTQPDRPQGRSRSVLVPPPVKTTALELGLPVQQPERPRGDLFLAWLKRLAPDLGVVVAYGHILRGEVLALPSHGMINVHASLLPRHRGAALSNWSPATRTSISGTARSTADCWTNGTSGPIGGYRGSGNWVFLTVTRIWTAAASLARPGFG